MATNEEVREALTIAAERLAAERATFIKTANDYGSATIRSLFLLNGGAAIALLTLVGAILGKDSTTSAKIAAGLLQALQPALRSFAGGLVTAVFAAAVAYLNYGALAPEASPGALYTMVMKSEWPNLPRWKRWIVEGTRVLAILACVVSAVLFVRGGVITSHAMTHISTKRSGR